ncbi:hypothetical protein EYW49_22325 [Siculibacillus lacustris]|uniref:Uncharacterized protein n=1 Tax=Siculibacillus lacustris TaxID=1549641 RepID=A0A4Q9VEJ7_9HYPH|nr:hypothetical protein [Siculibacillus lacustris]TBW32252.1 hypothetical protein EYW49_22325 [Siculibacillus lacustris]
MARELDLTTPTWEIPMSNSTETDGFLVLAGAYKTNLGNVHLAYKDDEVDQTADLLISAEN